MNIEFENGFFDSKNDEAIYKENKDFFDLSYKINTFLYKIYQKDCFEVLPCNYANVFAIASFFKVHKSFQSFIVLLKRGLKDDALIILRTMFEMLFKAKSIVLNYDNMNLLFEKQKIDDNILKGIKDFRRSKGIQYFAKQADLDEMYKAYQLLCTYSHFDINNLCKNIKFTYFKKIEHYFVGPDTDDIRFYITEAIGILIELVEALNKYIKINEFIEEFEEIKTLHQNLQSQCSKVTG